MKNKVLVLIDDLSAICNTILPNLRFITTMGGKQMVEYLLRAYVMGPIFKFMSMDFIPDEEEEFAGSAAGGAAAGDRVAQSPAEQQQDMANVRKVFYNAILRYMDGIHIPTEDQIRLELEKRVEAEKQTFIKRLDGMSKDRKQVELTLKKFGMGEWAIGGSKGIREYDEDVYENDRQKRAQAGIVDWQDTNAQDSIDFFDVQQQALQQQADGAGELEDYAQQDSEFVGEE